MTTQSRLFLTTTNAIAIQVQYPDAGSSNDAAMNHKVEPKRSIDTLQRTWEIETLYDFAIMLACGLADGTIAQDEFPDSRERLDIILEWTNEFNNSRAWSDWDNGEYLQDVESWFQERLACRRSLRLAKLVTDAPLGGAEPNKLWIREV